MARALLAAVLAVLLVLSASPVAAHGNHVEADSQHSADGIVRVEAVMPLVEGFVVLHRAGPDGGFGEPIGHTRIDPDDGFQSGVTVQMNESAWADWGENETAWVVYHENNGDPGFDPEEDPAVSTFGSVSGASFTLGKRDAEVSVLAERSRAQTTANATAVLNRVALDADGYAVLRTDDATNGRVVGVTELDAGVHEDVRVSFNESAFPENRTWTVLYAQVYADDGDGEFTGSDRLFRAGGDPVGSHFYIRQVSETDDDSGIRTPTSNTADVVTPDESTTTARTTQTTTTEGGSNADGSDGGVAGFGLVHAAVAALAAAALLARR